jgi:hypothetical protein
MHDVHWEAKRDAVEKKVAHGANRTFARSHKAEMGQIRNSSRWAQRVGGFTPSS